MSSRNGRGVTKTSEAWLKMQRPGAGGGLLRVARRAGAGSPSAGLRKWTSLRIFESDGGDSMALEELQVSHSTRAEINLPAFR